MADIDNSAFIGQHFVRPSGSDSFAADTQYDTLKRYDSSLGEVGHAGMHATPASSLVIALAVFTTVGASSTGSSVKYTAPYPMRIWAADVSCESAGGATGTVDVWTNVQGASDASILSAAKDVKTAAGTAQRVKPTTTSHYNLDAGDQLYVKASSGAGGSLVGGQALIYAQRL